MNKKNSKQQNEASNYLARAFQLKDLSGWISKKLIVPPGRKGIALFRDGSYDLFTPGENRVITDLDRFLGKGAGFWAGYVPSEKFNATVSISNLLSGDEKLLDLNILCDIAVENEVRFFQEVVIPQGDISSHNLVLDLPELYQTFASMVRDYTADDLTSGNLEHEFAQKASILLANLLPNKGIRFEDILVISLWGQEDRIAVQQQILNLNQKLKDLEFEQKVAQAENEADLEKVLKDNGIVLPKKAQLFPLNFQKKNQTKLKEWVEGVTNDGQPGHNFRLRSLLIKKEIDTANRPDSPFLNNWWVPRVIWIVLVILAAIAATYFMRQASSKYEWLSRSEFYITIWMFVLAAVIESVSKLFKQWEGFFADVKKPSDLLGLDNIKFKDRQTIDRVIREQSQMELNRQWEILNELRGKVYRAGDEDLALEIKQVERKLEEFLPKLKDAGVGKPVYLMDDIKLTKASWNLLMDKEEILLIKAAMLTQSAQGIQLAFSESKTLKELLYKYEAELDIFISDFIGRNRILNTESI
ncbi:MAG TPA: hypothetical protein PLA02_04555 [Brevefilum fermentans]|jgi:hypothetical protein|nr:hypothetical protein [Chloroflexota bacterium]HQA28472.1 hypothetical protein [Brevefilum fermentans]